MSEPLEVPWPGDWNRASLGLCTLQALAAGPTYGYAIITTLEDAGLGTFKGGTLYPLLTRFETAGWVDVDWRPGESGPGRKYFSLTPAGLDELMRQHSQWHVFTASTTAFLTGAPALTNPPATSPAKASAIESAPTAAPTAAP